MKAIIFGANGQDGFYLAKLLERANVETIKISRSSKGADFNGDVADRRFVEKIIGEAQADFVFHLAANSTTRHEAIFENHQTISTGTINILEAVFQTSPQTKIFLSGSAMQFENDGTPIDERTPFAARSAYAASRIQSIYAARYYRTLNLKIYVGYFFNHDSPRRGATHVNQKIALAAREKKRIEIGDPSVRKEFNFAGDIIEAVWTLVNQDEIFEAVIGSGAAHSIADWIELCFAASGADWREFVTIKTNFRAEYRLLVSNPARIKSLGWQPRVNMKTLAAMMVGKTEN